MSPLDVLLVATVVAVAGCAQFHVGFGFAMISMPLLTFAMGPGEAASLVAMLGIWLSGSTLVHNWRSIDLRGDDKRLLGIVALSLPLVWAGVAFSTVADDQIVKRALGVVLVAFALLMEWMDRRKRLGSAGRDNPAPASPRSHARDTAAMATAACASAFLGGAYNTNGPPLILYGASSAEWSGPGRESRFKAFLQAFFFIQSLAIIAIRFATGAMDPAAYPLLLWTLPVLLGTIAFFWKRPQATGARFQRQVRLMILALGVGLLW